MIINIRGNSGSGKSTIVRQIMADYTWQKEYVEGRRNPIAYTADLVAVLGHYETQCGGCDTLKNWVQVHGLTDEMLDRDLVVIGEGILWSEDVKQTLLMMAKTEVRVLFLTTPYEVYMKRIVARRKEKGNTKPFKDKATTSRVTRIISARKRLIDNGVYCRRVSSRQAVKLIRQWLKGAKDGR